jgi:hypothetical protein
VPTTRQDVEDGAPPGLSIRQRLLLALPHLKHDREKVPLGDWMRKIFLKPVDPGAAPAAEAPADPLSVEELEAAAKHANDKERLIGLIAAPLGAAIGLLVIDALITHDPAQFLKNGQVNKLYVSVSLYHELELVLLGLSLLMLVTAWFRKRLYLGMVTALYGLAVFNLHYWGFGIPFVMVGAWLLVRAYRAQRAFREATGAVPSRFGRSRSASAAANSARPQANKRYTPPVAAPKRPAKATNKPVAG